MRVVVAGSTWAVGKFLVPYLVGAEGLERGLEGFADAS